MRKVQGNASLAFVVSGALRLEDDSTPSITCDLRHQLDSITLDLLRACRELCSELDRPIA